MASYYEHKFVYVTFVFFYNLAMVNNFGFLGFFLRVTFIFSFFISLLLRVAYLETNVLISISTALYFLQSNLS
jgi:hypothetical protein